MSHDSKTAIEARLAQRREIIRAQLAADDRLELAEACKERFSPRMAYFRNPEVELGSTVIDGCDLSKPGCIWTVYQKPKVKNRD